MEGYTPRTWATHYEVLDVQGAIAYLRSREDSDPQGVALVGLSRGGSAALSAAGRSDGIWALVTDGAFDSRWVVTAHIRRFMGHFVWLTPMLRPLPWFVHVIYRSLVHNRVARKLKHPCIHLVSDARRVRLPLLMKTWRLGRTFLRSLRIGRHLPGGLARSVRNRKCGATAALTNLGETLKDAPLPKTGDRLIAGNLVLDAADFLAPIRPMTCASFSVCTYAGRLSICLQYDRRALDEPATDLLFETFLQQLQNNLRFS